MEIFAKLRKLFITTNDKKSKISRNFFERLGYYPSFENPKTFSEKIQWLKLYYHPKIIKQCSDKYLARKYIKTKIGSEYLIPLAGRGIYSKAEEINFEELPNQFALKVTNGWHANIICPDKSKLNQIDAVNKIRSWMHISNSLYYRTFQWGYSGRGRIICEEYISQEGGLRDYKFFCFNGKIKLIQFAHDRDLNNQSIVRFDFFDENWNRIELRKGAKNGRELNIKKPQKFELMKQLAEKLAEPFPFVRVDLYEIEGSVKVGELTFYPSNGMSRFEPEEWDVRLGTYLILPKKKYIPIEINKQAVCMSIERIVNAWKKY